MDDEVRELFNKKDGVLYNIKNYTNFYKNRLR